MGGELVLAYVATLLGYHGLGDMTPQALVAMAAGRYTAELCLALFGVYAILQAPLSSIGLRLPAKATCQTSQAGVRLKGITFETEYTRVEPGGIRT